jgi:hypothetical protein
MILGLRNKAPVGREMGTMTRRFGLLLACVAGVSFGCGCKDKDSPPPMDASTDVDMPDAELDAGPRAECDREEGDRDAYFLVRRIAFDREILVSGSSFSGEAVGFDLDGVNGVTCGQTDFTWQGETGIDNNLALLLDLAGGVVDDLDVDSLLAESIEAGDIIILARVAAWNGEPDDNCVDVALLLGEVPPDGPQDVWICEGEGDARTCTMNEDLVLNIDQAAFDDDGNPLIGINQQVLSGGRILTQPTTISLEIPFGDGLLALTLLNGRVQLDVDENGISNGILGGALEVEPFIGLMLDLLADTIPPPLQPILIDIIRSLGDLHYAGGNCNTLSVGMAVEGVAAEVAGVGACARHSDCDDGNACTINICDAGRCIRFNESIDEPCGEGTVCDGQGRCVQCLGDADCEEGHQCSPAGTCAECLTAADCGDDEFDCTTKECFLGKCNQRPNDAACDDGDACTVNFCFPGFGCLSDDRDCDDLVGCTSDSCDSTSGCINEPDHGWCNDGNPCTVNACDAEEGCQVANVANDTPCNGGAGTCQGGVCQPL